MSFWYLQFFRKMNEKNPLNYYGTSIQNVLAQTSMKQKVTFYYFAIKIVYSYLVVIFYTKFIKYQRKKRYFKSKIILMFDDINRKIHNQFYLNIEFVGGQILLRCFCQVSSVSNLYLNKLEVHLDFYTFTFIYFDFDFF